jgi:hypothetical protein
MQLPSLQGGAGPDREAGSPGGVTAAKSFALPGIEQLAARISLENLVPRRVRRLVQLAVRHNDP